MLSRTYSYLELDLLEDFLSVYRLRKCWSVPTLKATLDVFNFKCTIYASLIITQSGFSIILALQKHYPGYSPENVGKIHYPKQFWKFRSLDT